MEWLEVRFLIGRNKALAYEDRIETLYNDRDSLWNKYDFSRKSPKVPVKRLPQVARNERALALNALWDSTIIIIFSSSTSTKPQA